MLEQQPQIPCPCVKVLAVRKGAARPMSQLPSWGTQQCGTGTEQGFRASCSPIPAHILIRLHKLCSTSTPD